MKKSLLTPLNKYCKKSQSSYKSKKYMTEITQANKRL